MITPETTNNNTDVSTTDDWMDEVDTWAAQLPPEVDEQLTSAIAQIRQQAKDLARQGKM